MQEDPAELPVTDIRHRTRGRSSRISAQVQGRVLWFESDDVELSPNPEVFASALLIPALNAGLTLKFDQPLSSTWVTNCRQLLRIYNEWWGYPENLPIAPHADHPRESVSLKTALCFTGGADSFYSLLRSGNEIDYLVNIQGFIDTPLADVRRLVALEKSIREVARQTSTIPVFVRTNFLELSLIATTDWERAHGGGLMAVGHAMADVAARHLVSSSWGFDSVKPWGTHWMTDHLWSSASMQIIHVGAELQRALKLREIAAEPLVHDHLHVCWENLSSEVNCSRCDKCLRTRITLLDCGQLNNFRCLAGAETLAGDL
ncbi:MAG: hypothetical protein ABI882_04190, partial [Acidobacteriota bacterium]